MLRVISLMIISIANISLWLKLLDTFLHLISWESLLLLCQSQFTFLIETLARWEEASLTRTHCLQSSFATLLDHEWKNFDPSSSLTTIIDIIWRLSILGSCYTLVNFGSSLTHGSCAAGSFVELVPLLSPDWSASHHNSESSFISEYYFFTDLLIYLVTFNLFMAQNILVFTELQQP